MLLSNMLSLYETEIIIEINSLTYLHKVKLYTNFVLSNFTHNSYIILIDIGINTSNEFSIPKV